MVDVFAWLRNRAEVAANDFSLLVFNRTLFLKTKDLQD
jgi:hypothetical protein